MAPMGSMCASTCCNVLHDIRAMRVAPYASIAVDLPQVCMVFETMGPNVLALIKRYNFKVPTLHTSCLEAKSYQAHASHFVWTNLPFKA
eukprot:1257377-Amphidinium_carterae.1